MISLVCRKCGSPVVRRVGGQVFCDGCEEYEAPALHGLYLAEAEHRPGRAQVLAGPFESDIWPLQPREAVA